MGKCGNFVGTGGGGVVPLYLKTYQVIFGMPKSFLGAKTCLIMESVGRLDAPYNCPPSNYNDSE